MKTLKITATSMLASAIVSASIFAQTPSVQFTNVPALGVTAITYCQVQNVDTSKYGIAFFINAFGVWYTKPGYDRPVTIIDNNNSAGFLLAWWNGADIYAEKLAAFVVPLSYSNSIPLLGGVSPIPTEIYTNSIAYTIFDRGSTNDYINFSGMKWKKKDTATVVWGPGPNYFSGSNVVIDTNGWLHLKITDTTGQWHCAEIFTTNSFGYGTYRFYINSDTSKLPSNSVSGFFTWSDSPDYTHREIDIESSKGPVVGNGTSNTWQFVIQPYNAGGHRYQFSAPTNTGKSIAEFLWAPNGVWCNSYTNLTTYSMTYNIYGSQVANFYNYNWLTSQSCQFSGATNILLSFPEYSIMPKDHFFFRAQMTEMVANPKAIANHAFLDPSFMLDNVTIPKTGDEGVRINFWLSATNGLVSGQTYELVVSRFEFIPLSSFALPKLSINSISPSALTLKLTYPAY